MSDPEWLARQGWQRADLDANRGGRLSSAQIDRLRGLMQRYMRRTLWWTMPWIVAATGGAVAFLISTGSGALFVLPVLAFITTLPLVAYVGVRTRGALGDIERGAVGVIAGKIDGYFLNWKTGTARIRIGHTRMDSIGPGSDKIWQEPRRFVSDEMRSGRAVQAYYLPSSRLLVAAEPHSIQ